MSDIKAMKYDRQRVYKKWLQLDNSTAIIKIHVLN